MSIAERAYNSTTRGNRAKESDEDRLYRLATMHNKILRMIEQVNDARTFLQGVFYRQNKEQKDTAVSD